MEFCTMETLRGTILGKIIWHPCPMCNCAGIQNWDENGEDIKAGRTNDKNRVSGKCENCDGLGFVTRSK